MLMEFSETENDVIIDGQFYFRVTDNGMSGDRIYTGDTVLIDTHIEFLSHDIVAIAFESRLILRRMKKIGQKYITIPSNPDVLPEAIEKAVILGKVIKNMNII
jgi:SOS-response transcriptional repressor LexA